MRLQRPRKKAHTWFGEISLCSCLTFLHGSAWILLSKIYELFLLARCIMKVKRQTLRHKREQRRELGNFEKQFLHAATSCCSNRDCISWVGVQWVFRLCKAMLIKHHSARVIKWTFKFLGRGPYLHFPGSPKTVKTQICTATFDLRP